MLQLLDSIEDYLMVVDSFLRGRILFDVKTLCLRLRGVGDGWAGWAIAHPGFGRSVKRAFFKVHIFWEGHIDKIR